MKEEIKWVSQYIQCLWITGGSREIPAQNGFCLMHSIQGTLLREKENAISHQYLRILFIEVF